ncbi:MAG TPA: TetR/AcrR family transcriptional regulator, partial [Propionibacteriaceae bacterium]
MSAATDTEQRVVGRSARKRQAILHAARDLFLQKGYASASMDEVAAVAGVSKVTIYKHFSDKHTLFVAVVTDAIEEAKAGSQRLVDQLGTSTDIELDLRDFARRHVALVTQPHLIQMRRMIIAEAHRFP